MNDKINICIVHFNTPLLTECLVKSINKFTPNSKIYIFDNSDKSPFTYKQDNIVYLDNTKGQIINFNEWLKKYPGRRKSNAKINDWASAKHAYTVQRCIDIINDEFILLDSDVLLKKDISNIVDRECAYVAETELQPASTIYRVIPFICYINSKLLKENKVTYFNANYMHGLYETGEGDKYDTGAWFYKSAKNLNHKNINVNEYIIHFKGGSWSDVHNNRYGKNITADEWLQLHKNLYEDVTSKNNKVIYTCITNNYDSLHDIHTYIPGYDFICYTDNMHIKSRTWEIRPIPDDIKYLPAVKQQRYVKTHPHIFCKDYEISIWVDGNIDVISNPDNLINTYCIEIPQHPKRGCIYDEAKECIAQKKDTSTNINKQIKRYKEEGFPRQYGLPQSGIIIRHHNDPNCIRIMEAWWNEIKNGSHRDQLSFNYVLWKNQDVKVYYLDKNIFKSKYFMWNVKHGTHLPWQKPKYSFVKTAYAPPARIQVQRPKKIHIESSWNPVMATPQNKKVETTTPKAEVSKNKKDRTIHIKRLFY